MRPVPIPDARVWTDEAGRTPERRTLGAPRGHETDVHPIEVLVEEDPPPGGVKGLGAQYHVLLSLEDGDLERLVVDGHVWLTFWGAVVPFALTVPGKEEADRLLGYRVRQQDGTTQLLHPDDVSLVYLPDQEDQEEAGHG